MEFRDKNDKIVTDGDIIDLHQTVNGCNLFLVESLEPLDVRYFPDTERKYEYDMIDLLSPSFLIGETEFEIIDNYNK